MAFDSAEKGYRSQRHHSSWCVVQECGLEPLQFSWFRAAMRLFNSLTQCNSSTMRKVLQADSVRLPPVFVCLASPSILLVFFCIFCPALPQLCTLLGSFSFSWFPFPGSGSPALSSFLLLPPLLEPSLLFFFVVCQVPGGSSCNTTKKKGTA